MPDGEHPYPDFKPEQRTYLGETREVFRQGSGPAVIVMHEVPGLYPEVAEFGRRVAREGFTVYMPSLLGVPGKPFSIPYSISSLARACVAREFTTFATGQGSPITDWLRELARAAHEECGGPGVGAIGMCLTGGFALAMMVDDRMLAPVLSQPSLPFALLPSQRRDLGIDDHTLARVVERTRAGACVMGLRFTGDKMVPPQRFERLRQELGDAFIAIEIDSSTGNAHKIRRTAHSVLVHDLVEEPDHPTVLARERVLRFFVERLLPTPSED
ncbi:MAG TPA: dienelactone hydrolase [Nannocystis exedens]|nr:dienelactone hydrolase [Nannocystis exedens]